MKDWTRVVENSPFKNVKMFINAFFVAHGWKSCVELLGNTLMHEPCRKQKIMMKCSTKAELIGLHFGGRTN